MINANRLFPILAANNKKEGRVSYDGKPFFIRGVIRDRDGFIVYGIGQSKTRHPQVWRAYTSDAITYEDAELLFQVAESDPLLPWAAGDVSINDKGRIVLLNCCLGDPPTRGHPFYVFGGGLDGSGWYKLKKGYIYKGQDALSMVWNSRMGVFVNYQTSYQPFPKRNPDNIPAVRRVLHIRTSPDGLHWTPSGSFGVDGPYLSDDQLITPDELDYPDTEFYHFAPVYLGEFWAGIMIRYVSQPEILPRLEGWVHGPFLDYEWWISKNRIRWKRPFRENSALDGVSLGFAYRLGQPVILENELRWAVENDVFAIDRRRMFYAYGRSNTELVTPLLHLSEVPIKLEVSFEAVRRGEQKGLQQGYVMAELVDETRKVIPGFERNKCIFKADDSTFLILKWCDRLLPESNPVVRLRLFIRDARLYSIIY